MSSWFSLFPVAGFAGRRIVGLALKEFFLLLSSTGLAYRRCQFEGVTAATSW